jgi:hypothetical protein
MANAMVGDLEAYLGAGMNDYVAKPINPHALAQAIARQTGIDGVPNLPEANRLTEAPLDFAMEEPALDELLDGFDDILQASGSAPAGRSCRSSWKPIAFRRVSRPGAVLCPSAAVRDTGGLMITGKITALSLAGVIGLVVIAEEAALKTVSSAASPRRPIPD